MKRLGLEKQKRLTDTKGKTRDEVGTAIEVDGADKVPIWPTWGSVKVSTAAGVGGSQALGVGLAGEGEEEDLLGGLDRAWYGERRRMWRQWE